MSNAFTVEQSGFRWREDDASEGGPGTWVAARDIGITVGDEAGTDKGFGVILRLRQLYTETGGDMGANNQSCQIQYQVGAAGWNDINATSSVAQSIASNLADGSDTTQILGAGTLTTPNALQDDVDGLAGGASFDPAASDEWEPESSFQIIGADVNDGEVITFRCLTGGNAPDDPAVVATLTVDKAAAAQNITPTALAIVVAFPSAVTVTPHPSPAGRAVAVAFGTPTLKLTMQGANTLAVTLVNLGFTAHWPMGEVSGDAIDAIGPNDGTVTLGSGARDVAALNKDGDGAITFDNANTRIEMPAAAAIDDVFGGGGTYFAMWVADSAGEAAFGMLFSKSDGATSNELTIRELSGSSYKMGHTVEHTGGLNGWRTSDEPFTLGVVSMMAIVLDWDDGTNNPTWLTWNGEQIVERTIGNGLLERMASNTGTPLSDAVSSLMIGNRHALDQNWDGEIDEVASAKGVSITAADFNVIVQSALSGPAATLVIPVAFGTPTLNLTQDITPTALAIAVAFGIPAVDTVEGDQTINMGVGPAITVDTTITPALELTIVMPDPSIAVAVAFGTPTANLTQSITPTALAVVVDVTAVSGITNHPSPIGLAVPVAFGVPSLELTVNNTNTLAKRLFALGATSHWPMGEASGDVLDAIQSNDGTITLGVGVRNAAALNAGGDGSIEFDALDTLIVVSDETAIQNNWDGGGYLFFMFDADSDGESSLGQIYNKTALTVLDIRDESGGNIRFRFSVKWTTGAHRWESAVDIPINTTIIAVIVYDADDVNNDPTIYLHNGTSQSTLTVGSGLTQVNTGSGARTTDVGADLNIGGNPASDRIFDGHIDEIAAGNGATLTSGEATELINIAKDGATEGLIIPVAFGIPTLVWSASPTPLAVTVAFGTPAVSVVETDQTINMGAGRAVTVDVTPTPALELTVNPTALAVTVDTSATPALLPTVEPSALTIVVDVTAIPMLELTITPTALVVVVAFGTPTANATQDITPTALAVIVAFPSVITLELTVNSSALALAVAFSEPALKLTVTPTALVVTVAFGTPIANATQDITSTALVVTVAFSAAVTLELTVNPTALTITVVFGAPNITAHPVPTALAVAVAFTVPALELTITPTALAITVAFAVTVALSIVQSINLGAGLVITVAFTTPDALHQTTTPIALAVTVAFGTPAANATQDITPTALAITVAFGTPTSGLITTPTALVLVVAFATPSLELTITPSALVIVAVFGTPTASATQDITPTVLVITVAFATAVTLGLTIAPSGLAVTVAFGTPTANLVQSITPTVLAVAVAFGVPVLTLTIIPTALAVTIAFGVPGVSAVADLEITPTGLAIVVAFGTPTAGVVQDITPTGLIIAVAFGTPVVSVVLAITSTGLVVTVAFAVPVHVLPTQTGNATMTEVHATSTGSATMSEVGQGSATMSEVHATSTGAATLSEVSQGSGTMSEVHETSTGSATMSERK